MRQFFPVLALLPFFLGTYWKSAEAPAVTALTPQAHCEKILHRLWTKQGGGLLPEVKLAPIAEFGKPAQYDVAHKRIVIDPRVYKLCQEFPDHQEDALAFLIAHEFVHAYQHQAFGHPAPGFFVKSNTLKGWARARRDQRKRMESQADIWGAVLCYLSGYEVADIIPRFIERIYDAFRLQESDPFYDAKKERMAIAERAQAEVQKAIMVYETANYLAVLQQHDKDTLLYGYLIDQFKSAEFYNNLGLAYLQLALDQWEEPYHSCHYPLMLDTETRLEGALTKRQLSPAELLGKSLANFHQIEILNPAYLPMRINRACAYHLQGSLGDAETYLQKARADLGKVIRFSEQSYVGPASELSALKRNARRMAAILIHPEDCPPVESPRYVSMPRSDFSRFDDQAFQWEIPIDFATDVYLHGKKTSQYELTVLKSPQQGQRFYLQRITRPLNKLNSRSAVYQVGSRIPESARSNMRRSLPSVQGDYFLIQDKVGIIYRLNTSHVVKEWALFRREG